MLAALALTALGGAAQANQAMYNNYAFSGSGLFSVYHGAVAKRLIELGALHPTDDHLAGASGGALLAATLCSGGNVDFYAGAFDAAILQPQPPVDIELALLGLSNALVGQNWQACNGKLEVALTLADDPLLPSLTETCAPGGAAYTVNHFVSRDDLVRAVAASMFVVIPGFSPKCSMTFREMQVKDGYHSNTLPVPNGRKTDKFVGVSAFPNFLWGNPFLGVGEIASRADIFPGMRGPATLPVPVFMYFVGLLDPSAWTAADIAAVKAGAIADVNAFVAANPLGERRALRQKN